MELPGHEAWLKGWTIIDVTVFTVNVREAPEVVAHEEKPATVKIPDVAVLVNINVAPANVDVTEAPLPVYPHK
jgi:hypothetical protein